MDRILLVIVCRGIDELPDGKMNGDRVMFFIDSYKYGNNSHTSLSQ